MISYETSMGLRADETIKILKKSEGDDLKVNYSLSGRTTVYLHVAAGLVSMLAFGILYRLIECSASFKESSCEPKYMELVLVLSGIFGIYVSVNGSIQNQKSKTPIAIGMIRNNYKDIDFHAPLKGSHIVALLKTTNENTQKKLVERLNAVQAKAILKSDIHEYSYKILKSIQEKAHSKVSITKKEWKEQILSEKKLWTKLKESLIHDDKNKAYMTCKAKFGEKVVDRFVKNNI